jgi:RAB protein geranylgeranyltransferase component A
MTNKRYTGDFIRAVRNFWKENQKVKKFKHDTTFTIKDVGEKFNLMENQVKRILYNPNMTKKMNEK